MDRHESARLDALELVVVNALAVGWSQLSAEIAKMFADAAREHAAEKWPLDRTRQVLVGAIVDDAQILASSIRKVEQISAQARGASQN